ncbi:PilZ domain-containing protein [Thermodesulfobacteriota bacterium]
MANHGERRKYRRFEIPDGKIKIKKTSFYPVLNSGIGGINILFDMELKTGKVIQFELIAPEEEPMKFNAKVIWTNPVPLSSDIITGFEFSPFDENKDHNSPEAMSLLRRLYARYIDN